MHARDIALGKTDLKKLRAAVAKKAILDTLDKVAVQAAATARKRLRQLIRQNGSVVG